MNNDEYKLEKVRTLQLERGQIKWEPEWYDR